MVKFLVDARSKYGRLGRILEWGKDAEPMDHATPSFLVYTRAGHIPHLTWDVAQRELTFTQTPIYQHTLPTVYVCC